MWRGHFPRDCRAHDESTDGAGSIHDEIKVVAPIRYELEVLVNQLPDGNTITVLAVRFRYVEVLLQPNFIGKKASGIHDTSFSSNLKIDVHIRKELYAYVVSSLC